MSNVDKSKKSKNFSLTKIEMGDFNLESELITRLNQEQIPTSLDNLNFKNIKLKDTLDFQSKLGLVSTENPIDKLSFNNESITENYSVDQISSFPFLFLRLCLTASAIFLLSLSIGWNSFSFSLKQTMISPGELITSWLYKPYVVTIGEFGNIAIAKNEAKRLLPGLKQINIKELESGIFTFEIERQSSRKKADLIARELREKGFENENVQVRYVLR